MPEQKVRFGDADDILFPRVDPSKVKGQDFVIEQFIKTDSPWRDRVYVVRDSGGGLHLANGDSITSGVLQRTLQALSEKLCPAGQVDAIDSLVSSYEQAKRQRMFDALKDMKKQNGLPGDKIVCEPGREERVSLSDKVFAQMSGSSKTPAPSPSGSPMMMPNTGQAYGMGFPSSAPMNFGLSTNSFKLMGQVLKKADAPRTFQNIQYRPGEERRWQLAEEGMYLVRDEQNRLHAVHPEELSPASLNKLKSALFKCVEPGEPNRDESASGRVIHPGDLDNKPPATTSH